MSAASVVCSRSRERRIHADRRRKNQSTLAIKRHKISEEKR